MTIYAYFIENTGEKYIDNTGVFKLINDLDIQENNIYIDKEESKDQLEKLIEIMNYEDKLVIRSINDIARTGKEISVVLSKLNDKNIHLQSILEANLSSISNYYLAYREVIEMMKYFTAKHREEKYLEAKEKGLVGRPPKTEEVEKAIRLYETKSFTIAEIEELTKISKSTLYRYLKDINTDK